MMFKHRDDVRIFKALADGNRLEILLLLRDGEKCGCVLLEALEITQPTLSHHMKILCDAGLVEARKQGTWMHYSLSPEGAMHLKQIVSRYVITSERTQSSCV